MIAEYLILVGENACEQSQECTHKTSERVGGKVERV
jgi:hypothetical protein